MIHFKYETVDLSNAAHARAVFDLMNDYMLDKMGCEKRLEPALYNQLLSGLRRQPNYVGILVGCDDKKVALANCFINFSTFRAQPLLNIHDFVVTPDWRGKGAGRYLMQAVQAEATKRNCCKINLEVRIDNHAAQKLYLSEGFEECQPAMYFWEKKL